MKILYVSDLDGTLITRRERISEYSLKLLGSLVSEGLLFTYATARSAGFGRSRGRGIESFFARYCV